MNSPAIIVRASWLACALVSGCASAYLRDAPPSAREPWPLAAEPNRARETATERVLVADGRVYDLPELIDVAESNHPDTRIGWQRARQAALAVGIPRAGYFPTIEAVTLISYQHTDLPAPQLGTSSVAANASPFLPTISMGLPALASRSGSIGVDTFQIAPFVLVSQEVLNLGRRADVRAAKSQATAANALFTAEHERVAFEVARSYFRRGAAHARAAVSREALDRTRAIAEATEARFAHGVATAVERAEARRELAEAEYNVTQAGALEIAAHAALVSAMGIDARIHIEVADLDSVPLPARLERSLDEYVQAALAARPDLSAARARLPAAAAGVARATAAYAPRVNAFGTAGGAILGGRVGDADLPTLKLPVFTAGVSVNWVIFDGGLREVQAGIARAQKSEAEEQVVKLQHQVVQDVITAYNEVAASLSRYQAATALFATAVTADDAATKSYLNGLATLTEAMTAQKARALASAAREQAFADALIATAALELAAGDLTSAKAAPRVR